MDREKIIDGLRHCVPETIIDGLCDCDTCPYQYNCETSGAVSLPIQMVEDIRSLLKEQKAIESINFGDKTDIMANLEGLTWDDWRMYHSDTEVQNIAKSAFYLLIDMIDTPEIVRCKDCKHRDPEDHKCDCGHDIQWQLPRADDWYCADGKRRDDDA